MTTRRDVLFVCTGNICRSPTAEGVFRHLVEAAGLASRIGADSAGTIGYHAGSPPDPRSRAAAARRGYRLDGIRARRIGPEDFQRFDRVLAMDRGHLRELRALAPPAAVSKVALFLDPVIPGGEIPDPYYDADDRGFDEVLDLVERGCAAWVERLRAELGG